MGMFYKVELEYKEYAEHFNDEVTFEGYLEQYGYDGEIYASFEEFLDNVKEFSYSQGRWGRLLKDIEENENFATELKEQIETNKYVDFLDFCIREGW